MSCNIRYRITDGELLEANFGSVGTPKTDEAIIQADSVPDFELWKVSAGALVKRSDKELSDRIKDKADKDKADKDKKDKLLADLKKSTNKDILDLLELLGF